ncbi:hypothetical protein RJ640_008096 [Escallonia rubra]|uniref:Mandelate racemase/muconate lactonizing enzyme C-terminal domain-containing protein n=1 Tax=Escallonia rubra TaxID=112253 RepID=A0AA88R741_9ASTE|nr:hypothetical protein RJ640_008096 [Escallonia rubra]
MEAHPITSHPTPLSPFPPLRRRRTITIRTPPGLSLTPPPHFALLRRRRTANYGVIRGALPNRDSTPVILEAEDAELLLATCITRTLPPALTLEHGLDKIKEAVEDLKLNPLCCTSGMYRFQVAVSPGAKALNWFCCQPESSRVFPQFFLSKESDNPTRKMLSLNRTRGVFGIGAALKFKGFYSCASTDVNLFQRCPSNDSALSMRYGYAIFDSETMSSSKEYETGSFHLFIPQTRHHMAPITEECHNKCVAPVLRKFNMVEDKNAQMVYATALSQGGRDFLGDPMELLFNLKCLSGANLCINYSGSLSLFQYELDHVGEITYLSVQDYANINTLWASLIIEECSRLGLTYFCVAPGSRSSPLAIAASSHPLTTCIACFDERSLAFHAIGYARGSHKPAVVITSSGTAVSNLLPAVVEASQDFVPLLLLTADRPPELQDAGANQAINQPLNVPVGGGGPPWVAFTNGLHSSYSAMGSSSTKFPGAVSSGCFPLMVLGWLELCQLKLDAHGFEAVKYQTYIRVGTILLAKHGAVLVGWSWVSIIVLEARCVGDWPEMGACNGCGMCRGEGFGASVKVNHFGPFVRYFFGLPAPTDNIPARMVLTTLDSAVHWATSSPSGPAHINCPFREPLENSPRKWMRNCLEGLDFWMSSAAPFTSYVQVQHSLACCYTHGHMTEVIRVIQGAKRGLLLIGAIRTEDDIWAALLLAKHLQWPIVADILSGLRLRKYMTSFSTNAENLLFVDHLDHLLLSSVVREWALPDVVVQIGSRITSKRISEMLEDCFPRSYVMVEKHPSRHDPSHIVTHRIQSSATEFTGCLLKACKPRMSRNWIGFLRALDMMVAWEISCLIGLDNSLTEPYVAHAIPEALNCGSSIFIGNSMPIRDANMYGSNWARCTHDIPAMLTLGLSCHWIQVAGNRGASGIDGLLSTAIGFSVGCNKQVLCLMGDVSFLHDTNGLALLKQRVPRKGMTILVINNHGGAIFSLLPVADKTDQSILSQYFYTSHDVSIHQLCMAHGVKHVKVLTKMELQDALRISQQEEVDCVVEVESCMDANATFHSSLRKFACQTVEKSMSILSRVQLCAAPTSAPVNYDATALYREGFILSVCLEDGSLGFGEVAPLQFEEESLLDVEHQLCFLIHLIEGANISFPLPLLKGSFSYWIWNSLGLVPASILPSVRCGLEMAILNALAAAHDSSLLDLLHARTSNEEGVSERNVKICALLDSKGTPAEVAYIASGLVDEGFTAIKLKVGRRADPTEDAAVIKEIRKKIGHQIELRADANRKWAYKEAIRFGNHVKDCGLQYIEEPVSDGDDIIKFCEETGLPVAIDETIDNFQENFLEMLAKFTHAGVVAVVIKPSVVGGFENAALIARWAQQHGKMAVVSAAFESGLGLSAYIQFSCYLGLQSADVCKVMNKEPALSIAHGLGTYRWFKEDVTAEPLSIHRNPYSGFMEASVADAGRLLRNFEFNDNCIIRSNIRAQVFNYQLVVELEDFAISINVQEIGQNPDNDVLVFLHGFLGTGEDWVPMMEAISGSARCVAIDLPGHGGSKMQYQNGNESAQDPTFSVEVVAEILCKSLHLITPRKVTMIGYSMGARIALYMALRCSDKVEGAVIISGSPGLKDDVARKIRRIKDDFLACSFVSHGLEHFIQMWYTGDLWNSLRGHPRFKQIAASRLKHDDVHALAKSLSDLSVGRQPSLWEDLKHCTIPILFIVGERDEKFLRIAQEMCSQISRGPGSGKISGRDAYEIAKVPNCGHAAHLENPLPVISAVTRFLTRMKDHHANQKSF